MAHEQLKEILADNVTDDVFETSFYERDMASFPKFLSKVMLNTHPALVALPENEDNVIALVEYAAEQRLAITPRAGGTSAYMNSVPAQGGLVVDLTRLQGVISIDEEKLLVEVYCGTTWLRLEKELNRKNFSLCSYPSSAVSSTVGGWFNMEGQGIGSMQHGGFHDQVQAAHIVLASGKEVDVTPESAPPLSAFAGKEGTLGIVTRLTFPICPLAEAEYHVALAVGSLNALARVMELADGGPLKPYNGHFADREYFAMQRALGLEAPEVEQFLITLTYRGSSEDISACRKYVETRAKLAGGTIYPSEVAAEEWAERLYALRIKRGGPTMLAAEVILPFSAVGSYYKKVKKMNQRTAVYGHMMQNGKANIMVQYYADESRTFSYLFYLAKTKPLNDAALALGGRPYGTGVWNAVYVKRAWPKNVLEERRAWKEQLDPHHLMNPGKYYAPPKLMPPKLFGLACFAANACSKVFGIGRGR